MLKKQKIFSILVVFILNTTLTFASSSTSFQINEENINFAANEGYLESSSYELDLSNLSWTERYAESPSYTLIDVNSDLDLGSPKPPPTPPPTPSGGGSSGTGPGGGVPLVYSDIPLISEIPKLQERELIVSDQVEKEIQTPEDDALAQAPVEEPFQVLKPSPEEVEQMIEDDKNVFIFTENQPIIYYELDKKYDNYEFIQIENYEVDPLKLNLPDEELMNENGYVYIEGKSGAGYEIVSLWMNDDYVNEFYTYADKEGDFKINTSDILKDGKYFVLIYGLKKDGNAIIQTNYETVKFEVIDGIPYVKTVLTEVKKSCIRFELLAIYIIIILTAIYSLWKQRA